MIRRLSTGELRVMYDGTGESLDEVLNFIGRDIVKVERLGRNGVLIRYIVNEKYIDEIYICPGDMVCYNDHEDIFCIVNDETFSFVAHDTRPLRRCREDKEMTYEEKRDEWNRDFGREL